MRHCFQRYFLALAQEGAAARQRLHHVEVVGCLGDGEVGCEECCAGDGDSKESALYVLLEPL